MASITVKRRLPEPYGIDKPIPSDLGKFVHLSPDLNEQLYYVGRKVKANLIARLVLPIFVLFIGIVFFLGSIFIGVSDVANNYISETQTSQVLVVGLVASLLIVLLGIVVGRIIYHFWHGSVVYVTSHAIKLVRILPRWLTIFAENNEEEIPVEQISNSRISHRWWHDWFKTGNVKVDGQGQEDKRFHNLTWFQGAWDLHASADYFAKRKMGADTREVNEKSLTVLQQILEKLSTENGVRVVAGQGKDEEIHVYPINDDTQQIDTPD